MLKDKNFLEDFDLVKKLDDQTAQVINGGAPDLVVAIHHDDCSPDRQDIVLGCPYGWFPLAYWHTGPGKCDGHIEGQVENQGFNLVKSASVDSGWMVLCKDAGKT